MRIDQVYDGFAVDVVEEEEVRLHGASHSGLLVRHGEC
jgi:hypothetical protein